MIWRGTSKVYENVFKQQDFDSIKRTILLISHIKYVLELNGFSNPIFTQLFSTLHGFMCIYIVVFQTPDFTIRFIQL